MLMFSFNIVILLLLCISLNQAKIENSRKLLRVLNQNNYKDYLEKDTSYLSDDSDDDDSDKKQIKISQDNLNSDNLQNQDQLGKSGIAPKSSFNIDDENQNKLQNCNIVLQQKTNFPNRTAAVKLQRDNDFCNQNQITCLFWERRQQFLWNEGTQQCERAFICGGVGFETHYDCCGLAPTLCS